MKIGLHTRLKAGAEERYEEYHRNVWPEILEANRWVGVTKHPVNQRWQAEMAPMMAVATDFSGKNCDRMPIIFQL